MSCVFVQQQSLYIYVYLCLWRKSEEHHDGFRQKPALHSDKSTHLYCVVVKAVLYNHSVLLMSTELLYQSSWGLSALLKGTLTVIVKGGKSVTLFPPVFFQ